MTTHDTPREDAPTDSLPDAVTDGTAETVATPTPTNEASAPEPDDGTTVEESRAASPLGEEDVAADTAADASDDGSSPEDASDSAADSAASVADDAATLDAAPLDPAPMSVNALPDLAATAAFSASGHVSTGATGLPARTTSWQPPAAPPALSEPAVPLPVPVPPRTRWAGIVWGLFFAAAASFALWTLLDPVRRQGLVEGAEGITPGTVAGILLLAIGVLVLVAGLVGLFRSAQRRLAR